MKAWHCVVLSCLTLAASALVLLVRLDLTPASAQQAVVRLDPSVQEATTGSQFTVRVMADDVSNLAAYEFTLHFDPSILSYQGVANGGFLGSSGRRVFCPAAILDVGTVRFGCVSTDGGAPGASGSGQLATVTFTAVAEGVSPLDLIMVSLADPLSNDIPAFPEGGSVNVVAGTPGPTSTAGPTQTPTLSPTPTPTAGPTQTPTPIPIPSCGAAPGDTTVCIQPTGQVVPRGGNFTVDVVVENVTNLGAYQISLQFDPVVMAFVTAADGPFLRSSGRPVDCDGPVLVGNEMRLICSTRGSEPDGPSGAGVLASVTFSAIREGIGYMDLTDITLSDIWANVIPVTGTAGASVVVVPAPTPTPTSTYTPGPSPTPSTTPTPSPTLPPTPTFTAGPSPTPTFTPGPAVVRVDPVWQRASVGTPFTVDIVVDNVANLGAYEFVLGFDPAILNYVSLQDGLFLRSSGRTVDCSSPVVEPDSAAIVCRTLGPDPAGPSGTGVLATATFLPVNTGIAYIDVRDIVFTNPWAEEIPTVDQDGSVAVDLPPTPTPTLTVTPGPSPTPGITPTPTATRTPTLTPTVGPTPTFTPTPGPAIVKITPVWQRASLGTPFTVSIYVQNVVNLGAYEFTLNFDPSVLQYIDIEDGPFLGSSGRMVNCLPPDESAAGVRIVCVTLGPEPPGPSGGGVLATATFLPVRTGTSQFGLSGVILTDPIANVIRNDPQGGSVTVGPAAPPTSTQTPGPSPTPAETNTPGPSPTPAPTATLVPGSAAVLIDPASQDVLVGGYFTVDVMAANVNNLGAYEFTLQFDANVISYVTVSNGLFLGSTGRSLFCPDPISDVGTLRFGCVTSGSGKPGASGSGQLAQVVFQAAAPGESPLTLAVAALTDPLGETINAGVAGGSVSTTVAGAMVRGAGFLAAAAVLTGSVGLLLRPAAGGGEGRGSSKARRRWLVDFLRSLWRRIIT